MTRGELIRLLKRHGWREERTGKGSHLRLVNVRRQAYIWVSRHTKQEGGRGWALPVSRAEVAVIRVERQASRRRVRLLGVGALLGRKTSRAKARSSRANGRLGGRPPA